MQLLQNHFGLMSMSDLENLMQARSMLRETLIAFAESRGFPDPSWWVRGAVGILTGHLFDQFPPMNGGTSQSD